MRATSNELYPVPNKLVSSPQSPTPSTGNANGVEYDGLSHGE